MPKEMEDPPPPVSEPLAPDRCPNCGGPLKFSDGETEGLCAACGIYVEILRPLRTGGPLPQAPSAGDVAKRRDAALFHLNLSDMLDEIEEENLGPPQEPAAEPPQAIRPPTPAALEKSREEKSIQEASLPPAGPRDVDKGRARGAPPAPKPPLVAAKIMRANKAALIDLATAYGIETSGTKAQLRARLTAEIDRLSTEAAGPDSPSPASGAPEGLLYVPKPEPAPAAEVVDSEPPAPKGEAPIPVPPVPAPPQDTQRWEGPPSVQGEPATKAATAGSGLELAERPPEPQAPPDDFEWDEWLDEEEVPEPEPPESILQVSPQESSEPREGVAPVEGLDAAMALSRARIRRDRAMFYVGVVCASIGTIGFGLGSYLHDFFRVPVVGRTYAAFGSLNVVATVFGGVVALVGLVAIAVSLRGGVIRRATGARA